MLTDFLVLVSLFIGAGYNDYVAWHGMKKFTFFPAAAFALLFGFPAFSQQNFVVETSRIGGLRFSNYRATSYQERSSAASAVNAAGAGLLSTPQTLSGSSRARTDLNVNTIFTEDDQELGAYIMGDSRAWAGLHGLRSQVEQKKIKSKNTESKLYSGSGEIDVAIIQLLSLNPSLYEEFVVDGGSGLQKIGQTTSVYDELTALLEGGSTGAHVANHVQESILLPKGQLLPNQRQHLSLWSSGSEKKVNLHYVDTNQGSSFTEGTRRLEVDSLTNGSSLAKLKLVVNGYGQSLSPFDENSATMTASASSENQFYQLKVKDGQSLSALADQYEVSVEELMRANGITNENADLSGVNIVLPSSKQSLASVDGSGKTLSQISKDFDIPLSVLLKSNPNLNPEADLPENVNVAIPGVGGNNLDTTLDGSGKTLNQIADELGVSLPELLNSNPNLEPGVVLPENVVVIIPSDSGAAPTPSLPPGYEVVLPEPIDTPNELEYIDYGAYTAIEKVYKIQKLSAPPSVFVPAF